MAAEKQVTIAEFREKVRSMFDDLRRGKLDVNKASTLIQLGDTIVGTWQLELDAAKLELKNARLALKEGATSRASDSITGAANRTNKVR